LVRERADSRPMLSKAEVSARMSRTRRRDTGPELAVRTELHRRGLRYRVDWPIPEMRRRRADLSFTRAKVAVFIDGCFWHGCPTHGVLPKANREWWAEKLKANALRDLDTDAHLRRIGWTPLRFWEHEDPLAVADQVEVAVRGAVGPHA
jgi:DNA mismatch endonuclease (patch repair protein)